MSEAAAPSEVPKTEGEGGNQMQRSTVGDRIGRSRHSSQQGVVYQQVVQPHLPKTSGNEAVDLSGRSDPNGLDSTRGS